MHILMIQERQMPPDVEKRFSTETDEEIELEELFAFYVDALNRGEEFHPQEILAKHPLVRSYEAGKPAEGGDGVTVVHLVE